MNDVKEVSNIEFKSMLRDKTLGIWRQLEIPLQENFSRLTDIKPSKMLFLVQHICFVSLSLGHFLQLGILRQIYFSKGK